MSSLCINGKTDSFMKKTFIEEYLRNPAAAIDRSKESMTGKWYDSIDEELIYRQISSPEFHLYEEIVFCPSEEENPYQSRFATVA